MAKKEEVKKEEATPVVANASGESNDATATSTDGSNTQPQKIYATNPFYKDNWMTQAKQSQSQPQQPQAQPQQPTQKVDEFEQLQSEYNKKVQGVTDAVNNAKREQDAERVKEAKKQRNRQIINSIADGISAIANLGGTVHGAPDMSAKSTLTGKSAERYDKLYKNAEERRKAYLKVVQDQGNESVKNWYTMQKDKLAHAQKEKEIALKDASEMRLQAKLEFDQEIARAKEERDKEIHALDVKAKDYEIKKAEIDAKYAEKEKQANLRLKAAQTAAANRANRNNKSNKREDYILVSQDDGEGNRLSRKVYKNDPDYIQYMNQFAQDGWSALD